MLTNHLFVSIRQKKRAKQSQPEQRKRIWRWDLLSFSAVPLFLFDWLLTSIPDTKWKFSRVEQGKKNRKKKKLNMNLELIKFFQVDNN